MYRVSKKWLGKPRSNAETDGHGFRSAKARAIAVGTCLKLYIEGSTL
jgi:hypothetical protein